MSETQAKKPGAVRKKFRLFLLIFLVLLVPLAMDQSGVDRETVRMVGRVAAGITLALTLYGLFAKVLRTIVLVLMVLITLVFLVSEGHLEAPRVKDWFAERK
jgi:hypothetical protein